MSWACRTSPAWSRPNSKNSRPSTPATHDFIVTTEAEDVFQCPNPIPQTATLIFARLLFHFASTIRTAIVEIRPPDTIAYEPDCPLALLARWLLKHHLATDLQE